MAIVRNDFSLQKLNSFGIDARASLFSSPESIETLSSLLEGYDYNHQPLLIMGEGSNIIFTTDFEGMIVRPGMKGIEVMEEDDQQVWVKVGAFENWDNWIAVATKNGWHGLENLSLIPGSVGSAPVQNIGAYGVELKDHFAWLDAWDLQQKQMVQFDRKACHFGYRSSIFKNESRGRYIITHVTFQLNKEAILQLDYGPVKEAFVKASGTTPQHLRDAIISIREMKLPDPKAYGNAGSFYKNPIINKAIFKCIRVDFPLIPSYPEPENQVKIPAAWLIEKAGWKGKRVGNVGTWPTQPLVIVTYGGASGQEILDFSEQLRSAVDKKFGIWLEREVNVIG
jgi:UDP-N-acetylmuramate dehydrogenase